MFCFGPTAVRHKLSGYYHYSFEFQSLASRRVSWLFGICYHGGIARWGSTGLTKLGSNPNHDGLLLFLTFIVAL